MITKDVRLGRAIALHVDVQDSIFSYKVEKNSADNHFDNETVVSIVQQDCECSGLIYRIVLTPRYLSIIMVEQTTIDAFGLAAVFTILAINLVSVMMTRRIR